MAEVLLLGELEVKLGSSARFSAWVRDRTGDGRTGKDLIHRATVDWEIILMGKFAWRPVMVYATAAMRINEMRRATLCHLALLPTVRTAYTCRGQKIGDVIAYQELI